MRFDRENIKSVDHSNMYEVLKYFPKQVEEANEIGNSIIINEKTPEEILILGMGGSAIGGDMVRSYTSQLKESSKLKIFINRDYSIPEWVGQNTLVIGSSYSGGTEETLTSFEKAATRTKRLFAITTGGKLESLANEKDAPVINIPSGLMPRCALGYSFFTILGLVSNFYSENDKQATKDSIRNTIVELKSKASEYSNLNGNLAIDFASKLVNKIPLIYSASSLDTVNLRWRCQVHENAKAPSFGNILPEMNHNEINGLDYPGYLKEKLAFLILDDTGNHPKIKARIEAIHRIFNEKGFESFIIAGNGTDFLTRMFSLVSLGDWVSYYLAILYGTDPTPIPVISRLKDLLSKS